MCATYLIKNDAGNGLGLHILTRALTATIPVPKGQAHEDHTFA